MTLPPPGSHIHLIGIGGTGMSAIARVLLGQGYRVTGSDRTESALASALVVEGAGVTIGHSAANVAGADAVIVTSAAAADHVEVTAAQTQAIPVYRRSEIVGDLMYGKTVIAVAGTAGKTTTTAMITHMLIEMGRDPSYIMGGTLTTTGKNGHAGTGDEFVVEADEYDNMFLGLSPDVAVVTNIVWDHPDFFRSVFDMLESFRRFADRITDYGSLIACGDDSSALWLAAQLVERQGRRSLLTYGTSSGDDGRIENLHIEEGYPVFDYTNRGGIGDKAMRIRLNVPGQHNALNAAGALSAVIASQTFPWHLEDTLPAALATFTGTGRRFEIMGERDGVIVVDDYAHHPLKIRAALEAARSRYPYHTLWAVWQPHTYSRTRALQSDFNDAFGDADHVLVTPIYAARERPIPGIDAASLVKAIHHPDARYVASFEEAGETLIRDVQPPAVIMILSAGDAPQIGRAFLNHS